MTRDLGPDPWNGAFDKPRPRLLGVPLIRPGKVVVSQGGGAIVSKAIQKLTDSLWTHTFIVTGPDELTEAWFPRCRTFSLSERLNELEANGRRYEVLDYLNYAPGQREKVVEAAKSFVGRGYDVRDILHFAWKGRFRMDEGSGMFCSRLICEAFQAAGVELYPERVLRRLHAKGHPRVQQLAEGYASPADLFDSALTQTTAFGDAA